MKIVFIGSVLFSKNCLLKLIEMGENIVTVFTTVEAGINKDFVDLAPICELHKIPCYKIKNINSQEVVENLKKIAPDLILCLGFSQLIGKEILNIPSLGVLGYHPALLPANRGRHPIIWALFLGLKETGSTFFFMDEGADTGDIISQKVVPIDYEDDAMSLYNKLTNVALNQLEEIMSDLKTGYIRRIKQCHKYSNYWRKRNELDGKIDFRMSSYAVYNLVRALTKPYVGAHTVYKGKEIKIWKVREEIVSLPNIEPGKIIDVEGDTILVKCYDNAVRIIEHEFDILPSIGEYLQ